MSNNSDTNDESLNDAIEVLTFHLSEQLLCIPVSQVREVIPSLKYTDIPGSPSSIDGLISLRGHILTQINLPRVLELDHPGDCAKLLIIESDALEECAITVDDVGEVRRCQRSTVVPIPASIPACWNLVGEGVIKLEEGFMVIVDAQKVIDQTTENKEIK